jgi:pyruvate kinase
MQRTKIVATVGPASSSPSVIDRLIESGVDVVRLNFSHGTHEQHLAVVRAVREISANKGRSVALLQDLSGPKIRTGQLRGDGPVELKDGARIRITTDQSLEGTAERISTTYASLPRDVGPGDRILLDDGNLELRVLGSTEAEVECQVVHGGLLKPKKGMNLPGVKLSTPALTDKDRDDLSFGIRAGVDFVALSFVRRAADVVEAKQAIAALGGSAPLIAKIEKGEAIAELDAILEAADGLMVARGDLGVELSTEEVPTLQKRIILAAKRAGKPVITATQMLESMVDSPRPTRAEASDVANAILDGTDAIMLSAETASGRFPVEAVETMARIAGYTEDHYGFGAPGEGRGPGSQVARSLARVASGVAEELACRIIVAFTESGLTAQLVSSFRPRAWIAAVTPSETVCRRLSLWWGVIPILTVRTETTVEMVREGEERLRRAGLAAAGDKVVMLVGQAETPGATNMLRVHTIS